MGSFSIWHWLVVLVIVLLVFGTKRLTSGAKDLGSAVKEFKKGMRGEDEATPNPPTAQNGSGAATPPQDSANRDNVVR